MILLIFIAPFIFSFNFFKSKPRNYGDIAREIRAHVGQKLAKRHQMDFIGVGGGMMGSVYMIGLSFEIRHPMDRNEARTLIVDCIEELLKVVNANKEIRPFLKNYPFTTKNVEVVIYSCFADGRDVYDPYITAVAMHMSDYITFSTLEPGKETYKNRYRESYSEALTILREKSIDSLSFDRS